MRGKAKFVADAKLNVCMERLDDKAYALRDKYRAMFTACAYPENSSLCGNVRLSFLKGKAKLHQEPQGEEYLSSYRQISSPLALYRAVSIFETGTVASRQDFYKTNWEVCLLHKATGKYLMLGEWKGAFQVFTEGDAVADLPKQFVKDAEAFLTWFVSNQVPIGYDGVVAGSVA